MLDVKKYWDRIGFAPIPGESPEEQLRRIHRCHSYSVPFENFNAFCRCGVSLDTEDLYDKVVCHARGGYCFELNAIFPALLSAMGYTVRPVICRIVSAEGDIRPLSHRINLVELNGKLWACDVGYGAGGWVEPLLVMPGLLQEQYGNRYLISYSHDGWYTVILERGGKARPMMMFPVAAARPGDFEISSYYQANNENSRFVREIMCKLPFDGGMYTIANRSFKTYRGDEVTEELLTDDNFDEVLRTRFGIELSKDMLKTAVEKLNAMS